MDASSDAVAFCHRRGLSQVTHAPLEELPYPDGRFELVTSTDVIEHLADPVPALAELRRVCTAGATLLMTVPAYAWLWGAHDVSLHHQRRYSAALLNEHATAAGWRPVLSTHFFSLLLVPAVLVRLAAGLLPDELDRGSDLSRTPTGLNRLLVQPARVEAALIGRGVRLPVGLSIGMLCIAP